MKIRVRVQPYLTRVSMNPSRFYLQETCNKSVWWLWIAPESQNDCKPTAKRAALPSCPVGPPDINLRLRHAACSTDVWLLVLRSVAEPPCGEALLRGLGDERETTPTAKHSSVNTFQEELPEPRAAGLRATTLTTMKLKADKEHVLLYAPISRSAPKTGVKTPTSASPTTCPHTHTHSIWTFDFILSVMIQ